MRPPDAVRRRKHVLKIGDKVMGKTFRTGQIIKLLGVRQLLVRVDDNGAEEVWAASDLMTKVRPVYEGE